MIRDPGVHRAVLGEVVEGLAAAGLIVGDVIRSSLRGADGNVEFLARAGRSGSPVHSSVLDHVTEPLAPADVDATC